MSPFPERDHAVQTLVRHAESVIAAQGLGRPALENIQQHLVALARRRDYWTGEEFAPPAGDSRHALYLVSENPDRSFALYLNLMRPGRRTPPHNHTTWACIAAVEGVEHNLLFDRTDDGSRPGQASLQHRETREIGPGAGLVLLPDDVHAVEIHGNSLIRHLHFYGRALETLTERIRFDLDAGTAEPMPLGVSIRIGQ
jgi:predicted metal-dependent enzyme (double-stranded beta helix superfamily)